MLELNHDQDKDNKDQELYTNPERLESNLTAWVVCPHCHNIIEFEDAGEKGIKLLYRQFNFGIEPVQEYFIFVCPFCERKVRARVRKKA